MILRFLSGSMTPASLFKNFSPASTATRLSPSLSRRFCCTFWNSFLRSTPLLTKTQLRRLPRALSTKVAATAESTPPESAQMALPCSPTVSHLANGFIDEVLRRPVSTSTADVIDKIAEQLFAQFCVVDFRMKLNCPDPLRLILHGGQSVACGGNSGETRGELLGFIAVGHPDLQIFGQPVEQPRFALHRHFSVAVFASRAGNDFASQLMSNEVEAVTDTQNRQTESKYLIVSGRRIRIVDRAGSSTQNDACGVVALDLLQRCRTGQDDGKNLQFTDAARN